LNTLKNQTISIEKIEIPVLEYKGQRVITFKMIDQVHQKVSGQAKTQFNRNRRYMNKNDDFYLIDYSEKYLFDTFDIEIPPRGLIVLTETGYLMLVKSFTDELAWQVQRQLVNCYFRNKQQPECSQSLSPFPLATDLKERLMLIETKRKLSLTIAKVPPELYALLNKSLYEVCVRLGEVTPNSDLDAQLHWKDIISLPDGSVPF